MYNISVKCLGMCNNNGQHKELWVEHRKATLNSHLGEATSGVFAGTVDHRTSKSATLPASDDTANLLL